jgi:hypothetical protein
MLNYIEKPQNTYTQSWTVWELMAIENCGLLSGPRTIAVSWRSYLLVRMPAEMRARKHSCEVWEKCMADYLFNVHADTRMHSQHIRKDLGRRGTSPINIPVWCIVLRTVNSMKRMRGNLQLQLMALFSLIIYLMKCTDINITETTYYCQFEYEFGNQYVCNSCQSFKHHWPLTPKTFNFGYRCFGVFRYSLT